MDSYIFILCPNYSGSTLLWKLIASSPAVSSLPAEGQFLPEVSSIMRREPWNADYEMPWEQIKTVWESYWDRSKPYLIEKSPPHLIRTKAILGHFSPVAFVIMVRNPYAHIEGLLRRNKYSPRDAAEFSIRCLKQQAENVEILENAICLTYEELAGNPKEASEKIQAFLPGLGTLGHDQKFFIHSIDGRQARGIVNFNQKKINNLRFSELAAINEVFSENRDILEHWGYEYYDPPWLKHTLAYLKLRWDKLLFRARRKARHLRKKWPNQDRSDKD
jgi:hypothetical protein